VAPQAAPEAVGECQAVLGRQVPQAHSSEQHCRRHPQTLEYGGMYKEYGALAEPVGEGRRACVDASTGRHFFGVYVRTRRTRGVGVKGDTRVGELAE
jgi:hypothetical protein